MWRKLNEEAVCCQGFFFFLSLHIRVKRVDECVQRRNSTTLHSPRWSLLFSSFSRSFSVLFVFCGRGSHRDDFTSKLKETRREKKTRRRKEEKERCRWLKENKSSIDSPSFYRFIVSHPKRDKSSRKILCFCSLNAFLISNNHKKRTTKLFLSTNRFCFVSKFVGERHLDREKKNSLLFCFFVEAFL